MSATVDSHATFQTEPSPIKHMPALDGLRGIAILMVLYYHGICLFHSSWIPESTRPASWAIRIALTGWIGVDLFFVVSGFLITTILLRTRKHKDQLKVFWFRRALRIFPLAWLYVAVLGFLSWPASQFSVELSTFEYLAFFFYLGNLHIAAYGCQPLVVMVLWSLAVEEQFYTVWPFLVRYIRPQGMLAVCGLLFCAAPVFRWVMDRTLGYPATYVFTFCRADALAIGSALAITIRLWGADRVLLECRRLFPAAVAGIVAVMAIGFEPNHPAMSPGWFTVGGYSFVALCFAVIVGAAVRPSPAVKAVLQFPALRIIGKLCYGIYIWHGVVAITIGLNWIGRDLPLFFPGALIVWFFATLGVAWLSWKLYEEPILTLKSYFQHGISSDTSKGACVPKHGRMPTA